MPVCLTKSTEWSGKSNLESPLPPFAYLEPLLVYCLLLPAASVSNELEWNMLGVQHTWYETGPTWGEDDQEQLWMSYREEWQDFLPCLIHLAGICLLACLLALIHCGRRADKECCCMRSGAGKLEVGRQLATHGIPTNVFFVKWYWGIGDWMQEIPTICIFIYWFSEGTTPVH